MSDRAPVQKPRRRLVNVYTEEAALISRRNQLEQLCTEIADLLKLRMSELLRTRQLFVRVCAYLVEFRYTPEECAALFAAYDDIDYAPILAQFPPTTLTPHQLLLQQAAAAVVIHLQAANQIPPTRR
jgi:hypothetical protein